MAGSRHLLLLLPVAIVAVAAGAKMGGPSGTDWQPGSADTCLQGYVWRAAVPGDRVCVEPSVAAAVAADNKKAADRRASLDIRIDHWTLSSACGDTCRVGANDHAPRFKIIGDHFNVGQVRIGVYRTSDDREIWSQTRVTTPWPGRPGGWFEAKPMLVDCVDAPGGPREPNSYIAAYDVVSHRWSKRLYVWTGCTVR